MTPEDQARAMVCVCAGAIDYGGAACGHPVTQEDFLCDHCRTVRCWERRPEELTDTTLCIQLGCPEHSIPDGRVEVAF